MAEITNTTRIFKTIVLQPGEAFTLPPDGELVFLSDPTAVDSLCEIPPLQPYSCYRFNFGISDTSGADAVLEDEGDIQPTINYLEISGTQYTLEINLNGIQIVPLVNAIEGVVPTAVFDIYSVYKQNFDRRIELGIKFRTFASLAEDMVMKITGLSFPDGLYLRPTLETDCECFTDKDDIYCTESNT